MAYNDPKKLGEYEKNLVALSIRLYFDFRKTCPAVRLHTSK